MQKDLSSPSRYSTRNWIPFPIHHVGLFFYIFASLPSVWYHAQQTGPVPFRRNAMPYIKLIFEIILDRRRDGSFFRLGVRGPV